MKILEDGTDNQTLNIVPRVYAANVTYIVTNESTNTSTTVTNHATSTSTGYLQIVNNFNLDLDTFYELDVYDYNTDELIYRDKIFCTDQIASTAGVYVEGVYESGVFVGDYGAYSINKDEYVSDTTYDNEYIIMT